MVHYSIGEREIISIGRFAQDILLERTKTGHKEKLTKFVHGAKNLFEEE